MYYVIRNNRQFGPYDNKVLKSYVEDGKILRHDIAFSESEPGNTKTVGDFLSRAGLKAKIKHNGNIFKQIGDIGRELIIPEDVFDRKKVMADKKLLVFTIIGLAPIILSKLFISPYIVFYSIAFYFSTIWGLFFFYLFKTNQVVLKRTLLIFFLTQIFVFITWDIFKLPTWPVIEVLYAWTESDSFVFRLLGFVLGVGIFEETAKALPLLIIVFRAKEPLIPQTLVFYGLMSGIAFGVFEGVEYQMSINNNLEYHLSFFMNVARLTSIPFLHAVWAGIAGYYISFANLYPKYRISLYFLAIAIPAILHGFYDTLGWSILGVGITVFGVLLLMTYLKQSLNYQSKLSK